jgi:hypothetical protein
MKLSFIVPKDQIKLLEDGVISNVKGTYHPHFEGWKFVPKDTVLEVSQVYIRNDGWFHSSLTFKPVSGPGFDLAINGDFEDKKRRLIENIRYYKEEIKKLDDHDADWSYTNGTWDNPKVVYKKGTFDEYVEWQNNIDRRSYYPSDHLNIVRGWGQHRDDVKKSIEKEEKYLSLLKPSKPSKAFQQVIRIPLEDVEKWEVEIIRHVKKEENK